jgi:hypothetical protein
MNRLIFHCLSLLLFVLTVTGCTVEKRLYRKGWHVSVNRHWKNERPEAENRRYENITEEAGTAEVAVVPEIREPEQAMAVSVTDSLQPIALQEERELSAPETVGAPDQEADTVYMTPQEFKKWRKANHLPWTKAERSVALYIIGGLLLLVVLSIILLLIGFSGASAWAALDALVAAILLMLLGLILLLVLIGIACSRTYESMSEKQVIEEDREKERREALGDELTEEEKDAVLGAEDAEKAQNKKIRAGIFFAVVILALAAIFVVQP